MSASFIVALLIEASVRAVLVAALVGAVVFAWRVKGGAVRHVVWTGVMVVMFLMPALMTVVPVWRVSLPMPVFGMLAPPIESVEEPPVIQGRESEDVIPVASSALVQLSARTGPLPPAVSRDVPVRSATMGSALWEQVTAFVWLAGIAANLVVMVMGWRLSRRLVSAARTSELDPRVLESPPVSAPCAVGVWRVRIVVPQRWRTWSRAGREAALLHELAHVRRRDLLVSFIARVNRAVFWFHPLAWWLERRIAAAAEQACDEVVLQAGEDPERYALLLVELAAVTRANGARIAWQSLGMAHGGDLESRVDRVLTGEVPRLPRWRAAGLSGTLAGVVTLAIACQQAPPPLTLSRR